MVDNTQVNSGTGDTVRDIDRSLNPTPIAAKTQVVQIDAGGQNGESLVSGGSPLPVYNQAQSVGNMLMLRQIQMQSGGTNGFVPVEIPSFLVG
jgi:hypothetical protein